MRIKNGAKVSWLEKELYQEQGDRYPTPHYHRQRGTVVKTKRKSALVELDNGTRTWVDIDELDDYDVTYEWKPPNNSPYSGTG